MGTSAGSGNHSWARRVVGVGLAAALTTTALTLTEPGSASAAARVLLSDDFQDGDATGWRTSGGQWSVGEDGTNQVLRQTTLEVNARARSGDQSWMDYSVTARVKPLSTRDAQSSVGVQARVQSDGSHYYLVTRADGTVELGKVAGGRVTALATASYPAAVQVWRSLTLAVKGTNLVGVVNGTALLTATDTQFSRGRIALATTYATAAFDDVAIHSYAATTPDTQAPLAPGAPRIVAVTPTTVTISWAPTVDNVGVWDYIVYKGEQFYQQYQARVVVGTGPVTFDLSPTAASTHFAVAARDAAGNISPISARVSVTQPPSFPKTGDDTEPPTAPGPPVLTGTTADGRGILSWTPATDNVGVREYHVILTVNIDEFRVLAKVSEPTAVVSVSGGNPLVRVVAFDSAWNSSSSPLVPYRPAPTPTPTAPSAPGP